jgi:outer membrane biosynthesis protein TonB
MKKTTNLADRLRQPRRPIRTALIGAGATVAVVGASLLSIAGVNALRPAEQQQNPSVEIVEIDETPTPEPTPTPTEIETPAPAPVVEEPVVEEPAPPPPPPAPVKCPEGTVPNAVDDYGNESNCQAPCSAYDDNNVCIGAPAPGYREEGVA